MNEKIEWHWIAIGWILCVFVTTLAESISYEERGMIMLALLLLPFGINWLNQIADVFKHHPSSPSADVGPSSPGSAESARSAHTAESTAPRTDSPPPSSSDR